MRGHRRSYAHRAAFRLVSATVAALGGWWIARTLVPAPAEGIPLAALLIAYIAGATLYLGLTARALLGGSAASLRDHAAADDPGRGTAFVIVLTSSASVVGGALALLRLMPGGDAARTLLPGLTLASLVLAWLVTHAVFALHYAHLHYGQAVRRVARAEEGHLAGTGFIFPGEPSPEGLDFTYLAFTIGMAFQVSDVQVAARACRRAVLRHALLAFAYNTVLIAFVINVLLMQLQQGRG